MIPDVLNLFLLVVIQRTIHAITQVKSLESRIVQTPVGIGVAQTAILFGEVEWGLAGYSAGLCIRAGIKDGVDDLDFTSLSRQI